MTSKSSFFRKPMGRRPQGVTPQKVMAFVQKRAGKTAEEIGSQLGVTGRTVRTWTGEVEEYLRQCPEYGEIAPRIAAMIPKALDVFDGYLELGVGEKGSPDLKAASDVLKFAGVGKDKPADVNVNVSVDLEKKRKENQKLGLEQLGFIRSDN